MLDKPHNLDYHLIRCLTNSADCLNARLSKEREDAMSLTICEQEIIETAQPVVSDSAGSESAARRLFTHQTGQALISLGTLFKHIPPFNENIDKSAGDTLISIGKKLAGRK